MKTLKKLNPFLLLCIGLLFNKSVIVYAISDQLPGKASSEEVSNKPNTAQGSQKDNLTLKLDASKIGYPISPYIYGEFLEHQGRCIYGGIWAEMIRDRKFYYPVDTLLFSNPDHKSPWRTNPIGTFVEMDSTHTYVGMHSPCIKLDGLNPQGIVQDSLSVQQGKIYTGRIILSGNGSVVAKVSLIWGPGPDNRQTLLLNGLTQEYATIPLQYTAMVGTDNARLEIMGEGNGSIHIGAVSLMPADNVNGMRADVINLLKQLGGTIYRWPGGWFGNGYNWYEAIGDRDKRAPWLNQVYGTKQLEPNDFGPDEFMTFVKTIETEPYIGVSAMLPPDAQMAAEEVEYFNGSSGTPMGQLRAANGHSEPYGVRFWGIGCETWGIKALNDYVALHNQIAQAMLSVDSTIKIIAVGGLGSQGSIPGQGEWTEGMLTHSADYMDLISEHLYAIPENNLIGHSRNLAVMVDTFVTAHHKFDQSLPSLKGKNIRLVLDEWNYFWGGKPNLYGDGGVRQYFKDALGFATALHELFRNSDQVFMANTHPVNVLGHIKTTDTAAAFEVSALPLLLYRQQFGVLPLSVFGDLDTLDVAAALTDDRKFLTVGIVNPTQQGHTLTLDMENAELTGKGEWWRIESTDTLAFNEPGQSPEVLIQSGSQPVISPVLDVPPWSIILYKLPVVVGQALADSGIFKYINTVKVTPDSKYHDGGFARINYVPATGNFVVTFGTHLEKPTGGCTNAGFAYKEYNTEMVETGVSNVFSCAMFDIGSCMVGNTYYFVNMGVDEENSHGWQIVKYDAVSWEALADTFLKMDDPYEQSGDPMVAYVNGQLDISGQYNISGSYPPVENGAATFHYFLSPDLDVLEKKVLSDIPHVVGSSLLFVDSINYFVTANAYAGDIIVMKYDKNWSYLGMKKLITKAHFSTGMVYDGRYFYVAYTDISQSVGSGFLPVYLNIHLAAFNKNWDLTDDVAVTDFTPVDGKQPGRPWVIRHNNHLYVSYDMDSIDAITLEEQLKGRTFISIYEVPQVITSIKTPDVIKEDFELEQNYPNPCSSSTSITFALPSKQMATLKIYSILGREVAVLVNEVVQQGKHTLTFNVEELSNGIYFYQFIAGDYIQTRKYMVLK